MTWTKEQQREHRQELYKALRNGGFEQDKYLLHSDKGGYCCLGVACEVSGLGHWGDEEISTSLYSDKNEVQVLVVTGRQYKTTAGNQSVQVLPPDVKDYYGFDDNAGFRTTKLGFPEVGGEHLASLNDSGFTFDQIADLMEFFFWNEDHPE